MFTNLVRKHTIIVKKKTTTTKYEIKTDISLIPFECKGI